MEEESANPNRLKKLALVNPFHAPVYHIESTSSTMNEARLLAAASEPHGTVIAADFQEMGRGRTSGRPWIGKAGENLFFTILLRYAGFKKIPRALTLRTGLAVSLAIEEFAAAFINGEHEGSGQENCSEKIQAKVKWPNDVMLGTRKAAGILTEGDGKTVYIGIGVNVGQTEFPAELRNKAVSIAQAFGKPDTSGTIAYSSSPFPENARFILLEKILAHLYTELKDDSRKDSGDLKGLPLGERLYMKDKRVRFIAGAADSGTVVEGILRGIGPEGELLIALDSEKEPRPFVTGELDVY